MSAPAPMKFPKLTVEITQREDVPNLEARVVQGNARGVNLLEGLTVRRWPHARAIVEEELKDVVTGEITYVLLSPNARAEAIREEAQANYVYGQPEEP